MWDHGYRGPLVNLALAAVDIARRRADSALNHLKEAERVNPNLPGLHILAGRAYLRLHQWPDANKAFDNALSLDPDNESAWEGKAQSALGRHDYEAAAEHALQAVSLRTDYAEAHYHLGVALSRLNRPKNAETAFKRALSLRPNLLAAVGRLIELYEGPLLDPTQARRHRSLAQQIILHRRSRKHPTPAASAPASESPSPPIAR
jgi:tetratricopeptide (TPR) repeat protein